MTSLSHVSGETIEVKLHVVSHSPKMMTPKVSLVKTRRIMINEAEHKDNMKIMVTSKLFCSVLHHLIRCTEFHCSEFKIYLN